MNAISSVTDDEEEAVCPLGCDKTDSDSNQLDCNRKKKRDNNNNSIVVIENP